MTNIFLRLTQNVVVVIFLGVSLGMISSCKKDKNTEETPEPSPVGSAIINNSYTSFSRGYFYISDVGNNWTNFITLYRTDNSEIRIIFRDFGTGKREIVMPSDSMLSIRYIDASNRSYVADTGMVNITNYKMRDGIISITGGFTFKAKSAPITFPNGTVTFTTVEVNDGAFLNLQTSGD
jgi:hypothetical protein